TEQLSPYAPMVLRKWESRSPPFVIVERISRGTGPLLMRSLFLSGLHDRALIAAADGKIRSRERDFILNSLTYNSRIIRNG
ncbi:MAG: hypothetical protein ACOYJE_10170, partial [Bacteroidaceae bacterium]